MEENKKIENPAAFPSTDTLANGERYEPLNTGMTLRDYLAAKAMQGFLSTFSEKATDQIILLQTKEIAKVSYGIADAMLKYRSNNPEIK